jgi:hypothetical protein
MVMAAEIYSQAQRTPLAASPIIFTSMAGNAMLMWH